MSQYCMPVLIINMGGEMVYILEQRLTAQNVPADKSSRVLQDVIRTMYNPKFISELFRGQEVYSMHSTRQIFDRLAHSSIMRLNESSMDKLFDLMTMGFKYQLLACSYPEELLHVTLNHLAQLRSKVADAKVVVDLVDEATRMAQEKYSRMSPAAFGELKQGLCRFFSDKRVKVSLFLQDGIQKPDGTITLSCRGPVPPGADVPGKIVYHDASGSVIGVDSFAFPGADEIRPALPGPPLGPARAAACELGLNLYSKEKGAQGQGGDTAAAAEAAASGGTAAPAHPAALANRLDSAATAQSILGSDAAVQSTRDLNTLADLIGAAAAATATDNFKLNLFPDTDAGYGGGGDSATIPTITISRKEAVSRANAGLVGIMDEMRIEGGGGPPPDDDDDLLGLMDSAN